MTSDRPEANLAGQHEKLKLTLHKEGRRLTSQRKKILALFEAVDQGDHLTADVIYQQLSQQGEKIGLSTIYRTLHVMVDLGILREVELAEGKKYYELSTPFTSPHHHLVCVQCGAVSEFEDSRITNTSQWETLERGFALVDCQFTVFGICPQCQCPFRIY
jgi:Fur family ferric uptake transcriptional regulator